MSFAPQRVTKFDPEVEVLGKFSGGGLEQSHRIGEGTPSFQ
jgi:hypothetical protein